MYKGQGRIPGGLLNQRPVQGIPSWDRDQQLTMVCPHHELTKSTCWASPHTMTNKQKKLNVREGSSILCAHKIKNKFELREIITSNWLPANFRSRLWLPIIYLIIKKKKKNNENSAINEMLTAIIIVARVQPGTSKGITDLLLPQPSSGLKIVSGPSSSPQLQT